MTSASTSMGPGLAVGRLPLLAGGGACLLMGLAGGLARIGAGTPSPASAAAGHGMLMTLGFLGSLIALERAVALGRPWGFASPACAALGGIAVALAVPQPVPGLLFAAGGAWLVATYLAMWQVQQAPHIAVQAVGALAWWGATLLWLRGASMPEVAPWLAAFLVLTITGERLELARVALLTGHAALGVLVGTGVVSAGLLLGLVAPDAGARVLGAGLLGLAAWLARRDIARRTVKVPGVTRYMALCLLAGYAWLAAAAVLWLVHGQVSDGPAYDATLHSVFLGFAMSMVFGHAPVILPAVLRIRLPHHRRDYVALVLLHASLLLRLVLGDGFGLGWARIAGGAVGVVALLAFAASSATSAVTATRARARQAAARASRLARAATPLPGSPDPAVPEGRRP